MTMTPMQERLFREKVIREYQMEQEQKHPSKKMEILLQKLVKITPINLIIGLLAIALVVYLDGWQKLVGMLLTGIIYVTLISSVVANMVKK